MGIKFRISLLLLLLTSGIGQLFSQMYEKEYRIALVLPFRSAGNQNSLSDAMLDYYEGFKMAAMNLETEGLKLKLYVFDCEKDSNALENSFRHPDMSKMDVIVGPVYESNLELAESFCVKHNIILVSPLKFYVPQNNQSRIINFFVPDSLRVMAIAEKSVRFFPKHKFYIATDNTPASLAQVDIIRKKLSSMKMGTPRILTYSKGKIGPVLNADSVIIISTIETTEARSVLTRAIKYQAHSYVVGYLDWHKPNQSVFNVDEPQIIYPEVNYVSMTDSAATFFRDRFFESYSGEPSRFAYIGYDHATYLCYGLMTFGRDFSNHLPDAEFRGFINNIRCVKSGPQINNLGLNYIQIVEEERIEFSP